MLDRRTIVLEFNEYEEKTYGAGTIANMKFNPLKTGDASIRIVSVNAMDFYGNQILSEFDPAEVWFFIEPMRPMPLKGEAESEGSWETDQELIKYVISMGSSIVEGDIEEKLVNNEAEQEKNQIEASIEPPVDTNPQTGDMTNVNVWTLMMAVSAVLGIRAIKLKLK
jgi:hypothetical protein